MDDNSIVVFFACLNKPCLFAFPISFALPFPDTRLFSRHDDFNDLIRDNPFPLLDMTFYCVFIGVFRTDKQKRRSCLYSLMEQFNIIHDLTLNG